MAGCRTRRISQRACECHQEGEGNSVIFISTLQSARQGPVVVIELCYLNSLQQKRMTSYNTLSSNLFPVTSVCSLADNQLKTCTYSTKCCFGDNSTLLSCSYLASQFQEFIVHSSFMGTTTVSLVIVLILLFLLLFIYLFFTLNAACLHLSSLFPLLRGKSPLNGELRFFENGTN